jgi:hypothetical protein
MTEIERRARPLDSALEWRPASGEPFAARAVELNAVTRDGATAEVRLVFRMTPEVYGRVERESHFHLDPVFRGEGPAGGFRPAEEIWIEAALDPQLTARLPPSDPLADAAARLAGGGDLPDPALWFACYVFQLERMPGDMPPMRSGYSTAWDQRFRAGSPGTARGPIYTAFVELLLQEKWPFVPLPGEAVIRTDYRGDNGQWICYARVMEDERRIVIYSVYPEHVAPEKRAAAAEYLTRVNYGLSVGNFEMDFDDGEVRFRTGLDLEGVPPRPELFRPLLLANIHTMDEHLPGIARILQP